MPIRPVERLLTRWPDYIENLAWNHLANCKVGEAKSWAAAPKLSRKM